MAKAKASKKNAQAKAERAAAEGEQTARKAVGRSGQSGELSSAVSREAPPASSEAVHKSMVSNKRANTKPELLVRKRLREAGLTGYRLQWKVPGRPDVAWPGKRIALFVNGCFWHRCPHCNLPLPKSNVEYWHIKFERNVERDERNLAALRDMGWRVHVIWECQLKKKVIDDTFADLLPVLAEELGKKLGDTSNERGEGSGR